MTTAAGPDNKTKNKEKKKIAKYPYYVVEYDFKEDLT